MRRCRYISTGDEYDFEFGDSEVFIYYRGHKLPYKYSIFNENFIVIDEEWIDITDEYEFGCYAAKSQ